MPKDAAGRCLDTGHAFHAGMDPAAALERYADRLDGIRFKNIDLDVFRPVMGRRSRFFRACGRAVMCPIRRGTVDDPAIDALLSRLGCEGLITVERSANRVRSADRGGVWIGYV